MFLFLGSWAARFVGVAGELIRERARGFRHRVVVLRCSEVWALLVFIFHFVVCDRSSSIINL